jgi:predicted nucleic acid-binding protein
VITFDTGVLVAFERRDKTMWGRFHRLRERGVRVVVPASCESEWWRRSLGHAAIRIAILPSIVPLTDAIACAAGEALAAAGRRRKARSGLTIDAHVMATAALCGGCAVLTSDPDDLAIFSSHFRSVTIEPL